MLDHVFHANIIAYCQQNRYVRLGIYTDLLFAFDKILNTEAAAHRCSVRCFIRSSHWQMFCKKGALKNFATFRRKLLCWSLFLI